MSQQRADCLQALIIPLQEVYARMALSQNLHVSPVACPCPAAAAGALPVAAGCNMPNRMSAPLTKLNSANPPWPTRCPQAKLSYNVLRSRASLSVGLVV